MYRSFIKRITSSWSKHSKNNTNAPGKTGNKKLRKFYKDELKKERL